MLQTIVYVIIQSLPCQLRRRLKEVRLMEKDYFLDRSKESKIFSEINLGDTVYICEKYMQKDAKELDHLACGIVTRKLTRKNHSRGIKVEIHVPEINIKLIGRVVYLVKDGKIVRNKKDLR